jgi:hypothetical protein
MVLRLLSWGYCDLGSFRPYRSFRRFHHRDPLFHKAVEEFAKLVKAKSGKDADESDGNQAEEKDLRGRLQGTLKNLCEFPHCIISLPRRLA